MRWGRTDDRANVLPMRQAFFRAVLPGVRNAVLRVDDERQDADIIDEPQCKHAVERWSMNHRSKNIIYWIECKVDGRPCVMFDCDLYRSSPSG